MVDYDCINEMVSMRSEGKIEWLQELGPIVTQCFGLCFKIFSLFKDVIIYIAIVNSRLMSVIEEISMMSKSGYDDEELLEYIDKHYDEIECELNVEEYKEPKKHNRYFCMGCKLRKIVDYERSILTCTKCGLCEYYPVYVTSSNHMIQPLRRKCIYKRSDNFKVILNQFLYGGKKLVPDGIMETIRDEIHDETNILYNYTIPITIPILQCRLKRNGLTKYKGSLYYIYFKLSGKSFLHIVTKEYNSILNVFNVVSSIYDKYKPKGRKSFLNYSFVLKKLLIMQGKVEYVKCIPPLKTRSKQKELERVWQLIT